MNTEAKGNRMININNAYHYSCFRLKNDNDYIIAERLSVRQLIVQRSQVASVYTYIYIYISVTVSVAPSVSLSGPLGRGAVTLRMRIPSYVIMGSFSEYI